MQKNVFAGGATCPSRVMTAVATGKQGTKILDGFAVQPANVVPVRLHLRHISADARARTTEKVSEEMTMTMMKMMGS